MLERKNALRAQGCQIQLKVSADRKLSLIGQNFYSNFNIENLGSNKQLKYRKYFLLLFSGNKLFNQLISTLKKCWNIEK